MASLLVLGLSQRTASKGAECTNPVDKAPVVTDNGLGLRAATCPRWKYAPDWRWFIVPGSLRVSGTVTRIGSPTCTPQFRDVAETGEPYESVTWSRHNIGDITKRVYDSQPEVRRSAITTQNEQRSLFASSSGPPTRQEFENVINMLDSDAREHLIEDLVQAAYDSHVGGTSEPVVTVVRSWYKNALFLTRPGFKDALAQSVDDLEALGSSGP